MLQKLIDELNDRKKMYSPIHHAAMNDCIILLTKALPDFEEAIKKAFNDGSLATYKKEPQNGQAQDYYNQNYKNE